MAGNDQYTTMLLHMEDIGLTKLALVPFGDISHVSSIAKADIIKVTGVDMKEGGWVDSSPLAHTMSGGDMVNSDAQSKFDKCAFYDGTDDQLTAPSHTGFNFGSGIFTIDLWSYRTANVGSGAIECLASNISGTDGWNFYLSTSPSNRILTFEYWKAGGGLIQKKSTSALGLNSWKHVAVVRNGATLTFYIDGTGVGSHNVGTDFIKNGGTFRTGATQGNNFSWYNGYIDELRLSKGIARWTSDFDVPTEPYS